MSREKELAKNTAILTFGKICTQFVSFLLLPLYTAILEPSVYGIADLFNSYIYLIIPLVSLMLDQGLFRFLLDCRENTTRQKQLLTTVFCVNAITCMAYGIIFCMIQPMIRSEYKVFLLIDVVINVFTNTFLQFARGIGRNGVYSLESFLSATLVIIFNVLLLAVLRMGAWGLFLSTVIGRSVALIVLIWTLRIWKYIDIRVFSKQALKGLLSYSLPFIPNQLSWWVVGVSDRTIISWFLSVAANGIYSVANKFSSIYITFYNIFNLSWTESVSLHIDDTDVKEYLENTINTMFSLFLSVCLGIISFMPIVFPFLINEQYSEAYNQIPILMLAVLMQTVVGLYSVIYVALKKSKEIAKTSFWAAVINIAVDVALIQNIGLYAASISTFVAYGTMAVYRYFHIKRYIDVPLRHKLRALGIVILVLISYYINNKALNYVMALFITVYAVLSNKAFVESTIMMILQQLKRVFGFSNL